jgi:hypothetical protein
MPSTFYIFVFPPAGWQAKRAANAACCPVGNTPATTVAHMAPVRALATGQRISAPLRESQSATQSIRGGLSVVT